MPLDRATLIGTPAKPERVEICRSFSYKMNLQHYGGPAYESVDLFSSRKMSCSAEDADWLSQQIFEECVEEIREAAGGVKAEIRRKEALKSASTEPSLDEQHRMGI